MPTTTFDQYSNVKRGHDYALQIRAGKIPACIYVKGAVERYLRDINEKKKEWAFYPETAEKYLRLAQKFEHVIGKWESKEIIFEPWQCFIWMNIMGFLHKKSKLRRFRVAHVEIPRGNAKSTMASQAALYFLCLDEPNGNQVSTVATKKDQARIVLDASRAMARKNASFLRSKGVKVLAHSITQESTNSIMRALSSEAQSLDGLNDVLAVCDELHAMRRDTFETVSSGMAKRSDSLILCITTAGSDSTSVGFYQSLYAKKLCLGKEFDDDQFFSIVYCLDKKDPKTGVLKDDEWTDEKNWIKANPNLGVSVDIQKLRSNIQKAMITPVDIPNIKIKNFNEWLDEASPYFSQSKWDDCADPTLKMEQFKGVPCRMGVDLASNVDLASTVYMFRKDGIYTIFDRTFIPEATVNDTKETNVLYPDCVEKGFLFATPGEAINNNLIREDIEAQRKVHKILECGYDAWNATEMAQNLSNKIEMIKFAMNVANLSEPMKKLDTLIREKKIRHNGSPLLRWCLGNVVAKEDHNQNVFPRKSHPKLKIDPIVAILIALALWLQDNTKESIYETRGIRSI